MKMRKNNLGFGILSLALALALPLNANADEGQTLTSPETLDQGPKTQVEANTKPIEDNEIIQTNPEKPVNPANVNPATPATPTRPQPTPRLTNYRTNSFLNFLVNTNYRSLKDEANKKEEEKVKVNPYSVELKEGDKDSRNYTYLAYSFAIKGDDEPRDYTISVFALKDGKVKNVELDNFNTEGKVTSAGKKMAEAAEQIESEDVLGFRIKTKITSDGYVKAVVKIDRDAELGDYTLYYVVSRGGKPTIGRMDVTLGKNGDFSYYITSDKDKKDYDNLGEDKVNPFENLPFTKYLLNDTDEEKNLTDFIHPGLKVGDKYKIVVNYINPNTLEEKRDDITDLEAYKIPANSLVRLDVREKSDKDNPIKDAEIFTYGFELPKDSSEPISLMSFVVKKDANKGKEAKFDSEKALRDAMDEVEGLLAEKKKSLIELYPDEEEREYRALSVILKEQTKKIEELIQQALLDNELDKLNKLEKDNPQEAKAEYQRIADLVKEAKDLNKKANKKLIELDEINLIDNNTDPLVNNAKGTKLVLNIGKLTPLSTISDLTKDSPRQSERNFSKNLKKKLEDAIKKVDTVTIGEKDDKKVGNKPTNVKESKENKDLTKRISIFDITHKKDPKDNISELRRATEEPKVNTPIFIKYLQSLDKRSKLIDNK